MRTAKRAWRSLQLQILDRDGYSCRTCGRPGRLEVDHIQPVRYGGKEYDPGNLQALCRGCHVEETRLEQTKYRPDPKWQRLVAECMGGLA